MIVVQGLGCSEAWGIFLDQGLNPCLLHWQEDSLPLSHQGGPGKLIFDSDFKITIAWEVQKTKTQVSMFEEKLNYKDLKTDTELPWCLRQ